MKRPFRKNPKTRKNKIMRKTFAMLLGVALMAGCADTRSISHSSYREPESGGMSYFMSRQNDSDPGFEYRGELNEFDVLGINRGAVASDAEIQAALTNAAAIRLKPGSS